MKGDAGNPGLPGLTGERGDDGRCNQNILVYSMISNGAG